MKANSDPEVDAPFAFENLDRKQRAPCIWQSLARCVHATVHGGFWKDLTHFLREGVFASCGELLTWRFAVVCLPHFAALSGPRPYGRWVPAFWGLWEPSMASSRCQFILSDLLTNVPTEGQRQTTTQQQTHSHKNHQQSSQNQNNNHNTHNNTQPHTTYSAHTHNDNTIYTHAFPSQLRLRSWRFMIKCCSFWATCLSSC